MYTSGAGTPSHFSNGLPYESDGSVAVVIDGVITHHHQGLPFTAEGRLAVTLSGPPTRFGGGLTPLNDSGQLVLSSEVTHYSCGVPFNSDGTVSSSVSAPPPPLNQRYFTQLDGQSKFWRRETPWVCVDPVVEITFLGDTAPSTYFLFDGVDGSDRAYLYSNSINGVLNTNGSTVELNGAVIPNGSVKAKEGELNKVTVTFVGSYRLQTLGARFSQDSLFAPTIISSIKLIDPADAANTFDYPMDKNLAYALPDGETDPLSNSALIFENGSVDQSDRLLVTEKQDGSGFVGETGVIYDYAAGAQPTTGVFSPAFGSEFV